MCGYLLCPVTGRVLVQDDDGVLNLPGGTPEPEDGGDLAATLVREAFEESQVRVGATAYLGYQEVHRPGRAPYAQVRMAGVIEEFAVRAPDPDGGRIYRRLMTSLEAVPGVMGWVSLRSRRHGRRLASPGGSGGCRLMRLLLRVTRTDGC